MSNRGLARPFRVDVPGQTLARIKERVAHYPWHEMPDDGGGAYGCNLDTMRAPCDYRAMASTGANRGWQSGRRFRSHGPACKAIHIDGLTMRSAGSLQTSPGHEWAARVTREHRMQDACRTRQATGRQTLSDAMMVSPAGIAAWLIEQNHGHPDC